MITQEQYQTLVDFREADQARFERQAYQEGAKAIELALQQILAKERVYREDFFQLEEVLPGTMAICAKGVQISEVEFAQRLELGLLLEPRLRQGLEAILATVS